MTLSLLVYLAVSQACQQPLFCPPLQTFVDISHLRSSGCVVVNDVTSQFLLLDVKPTHSNSILLTIGTSLGLSCIDSLFFSKPLHERVVYLMSATSFEIAHELLSNFELPSLQLLDYFSDISRTPSLATIFSAGALKLLINKKTDYNIINNILYLSSDKELHDQSLPSQDLIEQLDNLLIICLDQYFSRLNI